MTFSPRRAGAACFLFLTACGARSSLEAAVSSDAGPDAGCAPVPCPSSRHWDPSTCACVLDRCPDDAGAVKIASISLDGAQGTAVTALDGTVYWTTRAGVGSTWQDGVVSRVSRCGGAVTTLASSQIGGPDTIVVDGTSVFWGNDGWDNSGVGKGRLMRAPADGGTATEIASGAIWPGTVALDASNVYWTGYFFGSFGAWKAPKLGGGATALAPNEGGNYIAVDATSAFLTQPASLPENSKLVRVPLSGGAPEVLVPSSLAVSGLLVIDEDSVYYESYTSSLQVMRMAKDGSGATAIASADVNAMAVDSQDLYWVQGDATSGEPEALQRVPKTGGAPTELAKVGGVAIALDETYVYWLSGADVWRLPK